MSAKKLIVIGSIWLAVAVALGSRWAHTSFGVHVNRGVPAARALGTAAFYVLMACYLFLLVGWILPLGMGVRRFTRGR